MTLHSLPIWEWGLTPLGSQLPLLLCADLAETLPQAVAFEELGTPSAPFSVFLSKEFAETSMRDLTL